MRMVIRETCSWGTGADGGLVSSVVYCVWKLGVERWSYSVLCSVNSLIAYEMKIMMLDNKKISSDPE